MAHSAIANAQTEFVFNRTFDASRQYVWDAFTQPERLKHWWGTPGTSVEIAQKAHQDLTAKGAPVSEMKDDLSGRGSGVKWFNLANPDGNQVLLVQA